MAKTKGGLGGGDPLEVAARSVLRRRVGYPNATSMRQLDRAMGTHLGFTSRLLGGASRLRLDHISQILGALGEDPAAFLNDVAREVAASATIPAEIQRAAQDFAAEFDPSGFIRSLDGRLREAEQRIAELEGRGVRGKTGGSS